MEKLAAPPKSADLQACIGGYGRCQRKKGTHGDGVVKQHITVLKLTFDQSVKDGFKQIEQSYRKQTELLNKTVEKDVGTVLVMAKKCEGDAWGKVDIRKRTKP